MKNSLFLAIFVLLSPLAQARDLSSSNECVNYLNSVFGTASDSERLDKALLALNLSFELKLSESQFVQIEEMVFNKQLSQDGLESMAYLGCTETITTSDKKLVQEQIQVILERGM